MFKNPNLIPRILRRQDSQESYVSSRPLHRLASYPDKWIYLEEEPFDEYFETYLFVTFSKSTLAHMVQDPLFIENLQLEIVSSHLDRHLQNCIQSQLPL